MTGFDHIKVFFNSKKSNKIFTRGELRTFWYDYNHLKRNRINVLKWSYVETCRLYLQHAGYLGREELGVYRKLKPIPKGLKLSEVRKMAYPKE